MDLRTILLTESKADLRSELILLLSNLHAYTFDVIQFSLSLTLQRANAYYINKLNWVQIRPIKAS